MTTSPAEGRRRLPPAARREQITTAARDLALEGGLTALTLRAIAKRVGVASGLVAHYEPSMEQLTAATFRTIVSGELDEVRTLVDPAPTGLDRLARLVTTLLDPGRDAVGAVWADAWSVGRRMPELGQAARDEMDAWHAFAGEILGQLRDEGSAGAFDTDSTALELFALIDSTTAYALVGYRTPTERDTLVRRALEQALGLEIGTLALRAQND
jgi:AcrR family transcriptional regulator